MNRCSYFVHAGLILAAASSLLFSLPAGAESSAASSASDSASDSVGSLSKSVSQSSDSSSGGKKVAAGDYQIIEMAAVAGQPGMLRLHLQAAGGGFFLTLPRQAAENGHLAKGQVVTANARPYGLELVAATDRKAFFLLVDDDWHRELASHPVIL